MFRPLLGDYQGNKLHKIGFSPIKSVFVSSDSVINREIHCNAQRCISRLLLRSSYSLIPHFKVLGCKPLTCVCTFIWSICTVLATCTTCLTINIAAFLPHGLCVSSTDSHNEHRVYPAEQRLPTRVSQNIFRNNARSRGIHRQTWLHASKSSNFPSKYWGHLCCYLGKICFVSLFDFE
jgi:hypothetical protein